VDTVTAYSREVVKTTELARQSGWCLVWATSRKYEWRYF